MSLLCCGSQCCGSTELRRRDENIKPEDKEDIPFYPVYIWNPADQIWKSTGSVLHGNVPVDDAASTPQIWNLERDNEKALWSFHVKSSNDSKLYVSYNTADTSDQTITLELADVDGKDRYFVALAQPDGRILLRSRRSDEMILWVKDGVLALTEDEVTEANNMDWNITSYNPGNSDCLIPTARVRRRVCVHELRSSKYWKSNDPKTGDEIMLITEKDEWIMEINPQYSTFQAHNPTEQSHSHLAKAEEYFASCKEDAPEDMLFGDLLTRTDFRSFSIGSSKVVAGWILKAIANERYVGKNNDDILLLEKNEKHAVGWEFQIIRFEFVPKEGELDIFPPFIVQ